MGKSLSESAPSTARGLSLREAAALDNRATAKNPGPAIGIDLGGSKTEAIVLAADGTVLDRWRVASPVNDYGATLRSLRAMVEQAEARFGPAASVGVGIPGAIFPATGLVKNANSTWLIGRPLQTDLNATLNRRVAIANDADCFALSEATDGAGTGAVAATGDITANATLDRYIDRLARAAWLGNVCAEHTE